MNFRFLILPCMIFMHIVDDYYLQGCLAKFKCKSWWEENAPQDMYKHDYIVALIMHGFSWSFMVHIPIFVYCYLNNINLVSTKMISILFHAFIHAIVDNAKANLKTINLVEDQLIHLVQIGLLWCITIWGK